MGLIATGTASKENHGNVGIGTTTPSARLDVASSNTANNLSLNVSSIFLVNATLNATIITNSNLTFANKPQSNASAMESWVDSAGTAANGTARLLC